MIYEIGAAGAASSQRMSLPLRLAIAWLGFSLLWLVFVYQISASELTAGGIASALTVVAGLVTCRAVPARFRPRLHWVAQAWRLPGPITSDLWLLLKHLLREMAGKKSRSSFELTDFKAGGEDSPAAAQRALAVLYVSLTPNSVVLDVDREKGQMLLHQAEPTAAPQMLRKLEE